MKMEWIDVKERLPEATVDGAGAKSSDTMLIAADMYDELGYDYSYISFGYWFEEEGKVVWYDTNEGYKSNDDGRHIEVTHWMPLPPLPEKKVEPLPCPFCGSKDVEEKNNYYSWFVTCPHCRTSGPSHGSRYNAILEWNKAKR